VRRAAAALALAALATPAAAACPEMPAVARFALDLLERREPAPFPGLGPADARCAQERLVAMLAQPWGDVSGHALAADVAPPLRGALFFANLRESSGAILEARYGARPALAPGLLLRPGPDGGVEAASPYLALLDLAATPAEGAAARVAGNLGLRLGVVGPSAPLPAPGALPRATLQAGGGVMAAGLGFAAPPAALLAALARDLAAEGRPLRPGEHVALLGPPVLVPPRPGETWRLDVEGLGAVSVTFR
jgi:2-keto-4-pentenoate hydratase